MKEEVWVISLGGSRIVPGEVDAFFLREFKRFILSNKHARFVVVTGGGATARRYIDALKRLDCQLEKRSLAGIAITRFHANFLMSIFGKPANDEHPFSIKKVKELLKKNRVVFCGALKNMKNQTSDSTSARIAASLGCDFINLTDVRGFYDKDPNKYKDAKIIDRISAREFNKVAKKIKFESGQHFVLDKKASEIILRKKVKTYIVGTIRDMKRVISKKSFVGTLIGQ